MNNRRLLLLIVILIAFFPDSLQAQDDSMQITKKEIRTDWMKEFLFRPTAITVIHSALPTTAPLPQPMLPAVRFTLPHLPVLPYYINPSPLYKGDYQTQGILFPHRYGALSAAGSQSSLPGIGRFNEASFSYFHRLNSKLSLQLTLDMLKVNMPHLSGLEFSTSGMMQYQATDKLSFRVFGSYAPANALGMKTHTYGTTAKWQINNRFGLEMGTQRYYNSLNGGWQTVPVVIPSYQFNKSKLEMDVGGLLYEMLRRTFF